MDARRTEYARSVAERIEQEFLDKLRRFMATSVPLEDDRTEAAADIQRSGQAKVRPAA